MGGGELFHGWPPFMIPCVRLGLRLFGSLTEQEGGEGERVRENVLNLRETLDRYNEKNQGRCACASVMAIRRKQTKNMMRLGVGGVQRA